MNLLRQIYEEIYGPIGDTPDGHKRQNLLELSQRMARLSRRPETWSYRALNGAMNEQRGFSVTHEMEVALQMIAAQLDQVNPLQALLVEITAYSINGAVRPGSIITGKSVRCVCGVLFVPHHNLQVYCGPECPGRPTKRKAKSSSI